MLNERLVHNPASKDGPAVLPLDGAPANAEDKPTDKPANDEQPADDKPADKPAESLTTTQALAGAVQPEEPAKKADDKPAADANGATNGHKRALPEDDVAAKPAEAAAATPPAAKKQRGRPPKKGTSEGGSANGGAAPTRKRAPKPPATEDGKPRRSSRLHA
jgi:hypothetical protein